MHPRSSDQAIDLAAREQRLQQRYLTILEDQSVTWRGESVPVRELHDLLRVTGRRQREQVWRLIAQRQADDADAIEDLWQQLLVVRAEQADAADFPNYLAYLESEVTASVEDSRRLHLAIEEWVTPVVLRLHEERRQSLGVKRLRPWDLDVDPVGLPPLQPFPSLAEVQQSAMAVLRAIDPTTTGDFGALGSEAECVAFPTTMYSSSPTPEDLVQIFHRWGHGMAQPRQVPEQPTVPLEMRELAGTVAELLAMERLRALDRFDERDAMRARRRHLENVLLRWPVAAMLDAHERWSYVNPGQAAESDSRAASSGSSGSTGSSGRWPGLWLRFLPGVDWTDLEDILRHEWQRYLPPVLSPLRAIIPARAQIGAVRLWAETREAPATAVARLRAASTIADHASLARRYAAAGLSFDTDEHALREAVDQIEETLTNLPPR